MRESSISRKGIIFLISLFFINLLILDWKIFFDKKEVFVLNQQLLEKSNQDKNQTSSPSASIIPSIEPTVIPTIAEIPNIKPVVREIYIPLGTGSAKSSTWDPLEGVEAAIDTSKYSVIKEAYFQVAIRIPTANGTVSAKLYNQTDNHDVWFSEISNDGMISNLKEAKITLTDGSKLYRVYLRSSLEYEAVLDFARIKLIVEENVL